MVYLPQSRGLIFKPNPSNPTQPNHPRPQMFIYVSRYQMFIFDIWYLICNHMSSATNSRLASREIGERLIGPESGRSLDEIESVARWCQEKPSSLHTGSSSCITAAWSSRVPKRAAHTYNYVRWTIIFELTSFKYNIPFLQQMVDAPKNRPG